MLNIITSWDEANDVNLCHKLKYRFMGALIAFTNNFDWVLLQTLGLFKCI